MPPSANSEESDLRELIGSLQQTIATLNGTISDLREQLQRSDAEHAELERLLRQKRLGKSPTTKEAKGIDTNTSL